MGKCALNAALSKKHYGSLRQLSPALIKSPPKPLHGILKRSMRKASLSKTQPVSLTYKFNKKIAVRDQFRQFNDRDVLQGAGKVSKKMADETAPKK
ncbi:hypothetical protein AT469_03875 [Klebsiella pneumoniae]|nr:hypothetical protein AT471_17915 [Klebsiella pneumoniae]OFV35364.1 hypothetical protein HMPREF3140_15815 [Klebsiella sp. HMSC16A12]KSV01246.1 hypothetical protein AT470_01610 [Klebsiella pneumoniae]KSV03814.1 hypothetical protein AT473_03930 [Klebsiella pneumoniae]KSV08567.1 hypothetical protein AT472_14575 [Klebsiella pneumoniae]